MFARSIFNFCCAAMVLAHAVVEEQEQKISFLVFIFGFLFLWALGARPYRHSHTNAIFIALSFCMALVSFELMMKISGFKSTLFVDKYFFWMQLIQGGFIWFMISVYLLLLLLTKSRWNVNKDFVAEFTGGQEMAISYILKARKFNEKVRRARHYGPAEKEEMEDNMKHLEAEFNSLRDKQPVIMDAMLETIENLKIMRKNYEEDPDVYDFDYKTFLDGTVKERARIYEHRKLEYQEEDQEDESQDDNNEINI